MKLSVIMPVYNVERYLPTMVDSVLAQSYREFEFIMVDDGSTDGSGALCDDYAARDDRIRVIHKENGGVSTARNAGIDAATGEYLYFVDADDYLYPEALETMLREIGGRDYIVVRYQRGTRDEFPERSKTRVATVNERQTADNFEELCQRFNYFYPNSSAWRSLMRRDIIVDNNLRFNPKLHVGEDLVFMHTYIRYVHSAAFIDYQAVYYMQNTTSAMHDYRRIAEDEYFDQLNRYMDANTAHFAPSLTQAMIDRWHHIFIQRYYVVFLLYALKGYQPECRVPRKERLRRWKRVRGEKWFQAGVHKSFHKHWAYRIVERCCTTGIYPLVDPLLVILGNHNLLRFRSMSG